MHKEDKIEGAERLENLRELATLAARYDHLPIGDGLEAFMESAALASDQDVSGLCLSGKGRIEALHGVWRKHLDTRFALHREFQWH